MDKVHDVRVRIIHGNHKSRDSSSAVGELASFEPDAIEHFYETMIRFEVYVVWYMNTASDALPEPVGAVLDNFRSIGFTKVTNCAVGHDELAVRSLPSPSCEDKGAVFEEALHVFARDSDSRVLNRRSDPFGQGVLPGLVGRDA